MLRVFAAAATLAALLSPAAAQCTGVECCTAEEALRHQCTECYDPTGNSERCIVEAGDCSTCFAGLSPPIPAGQNFQMSCTGTPDPAPVRPLPP